MQMLTKFESKSSRAKGVAFHPKRPWILVSLHSSTIQLWDYRMGTIIDRFEGHDGPVRGVDFHKTQPLFASCGDDYTVKVWSLQSRKCLFTLTGHLDYVRTVFFHDDLPWLISCSDDQTIRIWNWQNRQEIACLTGHNHYVMCAQFHPTEDLIVSASLDQTVRVWDISGLRKKHSAPTNSMTSFEDQLARANAPQQDIFGNTDAIVKYVLDGHDRGVNWAAFHPTLPLIVSAGDDRMLKLWRMSETKAWEVDTCRGHLNNILCCLFHPYQELILSLGEDKTIRTWDLNKRTPVAQFKRESDKFWCLAAHPNINLFAACHDSGVMVFKLERERPASALHQNNLFYINKDKQLKYFDINSGNESSPLLSLKKIGNTWSPFRSLSYNPSDRSVLAITSNEHGNIYELINLPKDAAGAIEPTNTIRGSGDQALFIARNRFAVLTKSNNSISVHDLSNAVTKSVTPPITVKDILYGGQNLLLLLGASSVVLYDIQQKKTVAELAVQGVKYASWSNDGQYVALLSKHTITIATKTLQNVSSLHETIRIKSATWDDSGILIYSTLNHLKYSLLNGDNGILKTLQNTLYLVKVKGNAVYCLSRGGGVEVVKIDPTEYRFKRALVNKNFNEVLRIIKTSSLVGQSIIAYLQKKGYPEIALQFVQDPQTKFDLAIECGNLDAACQQARELGSMVAWKRLGEEALAQGNHEIVEEVYQKQHAFDKLSFLYLLTGNISRLQRMEDIAEKRGDTASRYQTSLFLNSVESRIQMLREAGMNPLAYSLAKSNGLTDLAQEILDTSEVNEAGVEVNIVDVTEDNIPAVTHDTFSAKWPLKSTSLSFFEQAILSGNVENLSLEEETEERRATVTGDLIDETFEEEEEAHDENAWDMDLDDNLGEIPAQAEALAAGPASETDVWIRNSSVPADHIAAGSFESAAQLLNRQAGVTNFAPLKKRFMDVYRASKLYLSATDSLPALRFYSRRNEEDETKVLPSVPGFDRIKPMLNEAYKCVKGNKLELAIETFREILYTIVTLSVSDSEEADFCKSVIEICKNYILAFTIELERRRIGDNDVKRNLELAAYFTKPKLQAAHASIALMVAMKQSLSNKNYASASYFAQKLIEAPKAPPQAIEQARRVKAKADASPLDEVEINFDQFAEFEVCPATLTPIYDGQPSIKEPLTGANYQPSAQGSLCKITGITTVGAPGSGLRLLA
ncbi:coatomer subunit alpha [Trichomonascus vanleenenianus]|uniref:coatomer subunit alpha n=1 Tax=Trichomonascus vanleenenianus TaxID=2268995 RepID=UPI003EC98BAE